jgi:ABC-type amino acid transport system permease subunit
MLKFSVLEPYMPLLASAVWITLKFTFLSTFLGFLGGFVLALISISKNRILVPLAKFYISVFAGRRCWCSSC